MPQLYVRRQRNQTLQLKSGNGRWVEGEELHHRDDQTSYSSIFASSTAGSFENILHAVPQSLNSHDALCMAVSDKKGKRAVFSLGGLKDAGPDGFGGLFHQ
ncbi:hypothetical protein H0E87_007708 [Populus deltoides]|jgi:hypothetical protein|uniref:Uncharacterized protein n=1 Tax=Populus deltoides TaxID=3696 RepID=A0A8T2YXL6_POPDE|nr:hypothetical protein H0E87_007708 [Populus deltoides]